MEKIIIIGAGGHAQTVVDTIERGHCFEIAGFLAEGRVGERVYKNYTILGADNIAKTIFSMGISKACMAIGFMGKSSIREKLCCQYKKMGFDFPAIIDPSAIVASDVMIGEGTYIGRCVVVNANSSIGDFCILNTGCIVEHECKVGKYSHVSIGAVICGQSVIGERTFIGANATVIQCLTIGNDCIVGAGTVVIRNIEERKTMVGNPAKEIRE